MLLPKISQYGNNPSCPPYLDSFLQFCEQLDWTGSGGTWQGNSVALVGHWKRKLQVK